MRILSRAIDLGIIQDSCRDKISPEQMRILDFLSDLVENESLKADSDDEMRQEVQKEIDDLNDIIDLEECDRVFPDKSFSRECVEASLPISLTSFMKDALLPALRKIVEEGP